MAGAASLSIGITGSAGSGKSTLCALWTVRGARRVDADEIGRSFLRRDSEVFSKVVEAFGPAILGPGGDVDRARLGRRVFADSVELERLNSIVHPPLLRALHAELGRFRTDPGPSRILLLDAALLVEWGDRSLWDRLVLVTAPRAIQIERIVAQRGLSAAEAALRLDAQLPESVRRPLADHVVTNDGDPAHLARQAETLWNEWQASLA